MSESQPRIVQHCDDAYESIRAIAHMAGSIPAPIAYAMLGNLNCLANTLSEVVERLGGQLRASLDEYNVYDGKGEPTESVDALNERTHKAALLLKEVGRLLAEAQAAINSQGYDKS